MREKQEAIEDKTFDKLSDLNVSESSPTKDLIAKKKDSFKNEGKNTINIIISKSQRDSVTAVKYILSSGEENGKLLTSEDSTAAKKTLLDDEELKASRQRSDTCQTMKENVEEVTSKEKDKASTKQMSMKIVTKESSAENVEFKEDKDLNKDIKFSQKMQADEKQKTEAFTESTDDDKYLDDSARGKSADLSSTESRASMLNAEESFSPERMGSPHDKKLERIKNDKERPETETGKSSKYI